MGCKTQKFFFEAARIRFGIEHCRTITTVADVSGDLQDTYIDLNGTNPNFEEVPGYLYIGTDPELVGKTGYEVTVSSNATAAQVANAIASALTSVNIFRVSVTGSVVHIENRFGGSITEETDSGLTGFTVAVAKEGSGLDLGSTADGIELSLEGAFGDVTTNQSGELLKAQIAQGTSASLTANFNELTNEVKRELIARVTGDKVETISGGEVVGYGTSRLFQDIAVLGGQLVVHPIRLPSSDFSRDLVFWNSAPKPESLNFDGTSVQQMSTTFEAYVDERYKDEISLLAIAGLNGADWTSKELDK
jgi:hypothetical protein